MITEQTSTSFTIDVSGFDLKPLAPHPCNARGWNHRAITRAFPMDFAAHHELVALLVEDDPAQHSLPNPTPPPRAPRVTNGPNSVLRAEDLV